jgi:hypothetical protein
MGEFQLILLSELDRTAIRQARHSGAFPLTHTRSPTGVGMAAITPPDYLAHRRTAPGNEWLPAKQALALVRATLHNDYNLAADTIATRLKAGLATASFKSVLWEGIPEDSGGTLLKDKVIDRRFWENYSNHDASRLVWATGDMKLNIGHFNSLDGEGIGFVTFFGVQIDQRGIDEIIGNTAVPLEMIVSDKKRTATPPAPASNVGSRPRNDWWDEFWIEICRQIFDNELKVEHQADIEKAMLTWATNHSKNLSEAYAREKARKLFKAWKLGARN